MAGEIKIAIVLVLLALFCGENYWVFNQGKAVERAAMVARDSKGKDVVINAVVKHAADNDKIEAKQDAKSRKVSQDAQAEITAVRDFKPAAISMRFNVPAASISIKPSAPEKAAGSAEPDVTATAAVVLPEEIAGELRADAKRADHIVAECRGLQEWVKDQGFYGPPDPDPEPENEQSDEKED